MLKVLEDPTLKKLETIQHGFFTRHGGVSTHHYASLNCGYLSQDHPDNVRENLRRVTTYLNHPLASLAITQNVHGNRVVIVEKPWLEQQKPAADAMVTRQHQIILGSTSADCAIVLFADEQAGVIGLAHAGWRGTQKGVIQATVEKMISLGATSHHISAAISPCIAQDSYEVNKDFYQQFVNKNPAHQHHFKPANKINHFFFDLPGYIKTCLMQLNVKSVSLAVAVDTYTNEKDFFSCRRALHTGEPDFGRQLSCIYLLYFSKQMP